MLALYVFQTVTFSYTKVQHLAFIPFLALYVPIFWFFTKLFMIKKKYYDELGAVGFDTKFLRYTF